MKVIVPLNEKAGQNSKTSEHFGSAPFFAITDTVTGSLEIIANTSMHHNHGKCTPADLFSQLKIDAVLCNGIGAGAVARLQMIGIEVYMAARASTLEEALTLFSKGKLTKVTAQQTCQAHACH